MTHKPGFCGRCGGTKGQHTGPDLCWCARCLALPESDRCPRWTDRKPIDVTNRPAEMPSTLSSKRDGSTQRAGAVVGAVKAGTRRAETFAVIVAAGGRGVTFDELCRILGREYSHVGPRVRELVRDGHVKRSGSTRVASTGAQQDVWVDASLIPIQEAML